MQLPALDAVGADTDALGLGLERADIGAAGLLGHELRALEHDRRVLAEQPVEQQLLQRRRAEALDDEVGGVRHRDRAHQAELGLHEEIGDAVLHQRMRGLLHAQHAGAMAHGVHAEVVEGDLLHLAVGGMVVDPVLVAAEAVARLQHRRMLVGHHGEIVEPVAGERAQPLEMRRHRRPQAGLQVERQQVLELPVDRHRSSGHAHRVRCVRRRAAAWPGRLACRAWVSPYCGQPRLPGRARHRAARSGWRGRRCVPGTKAGCRSVRG